MTWRTSGCHHGPARRPHARADCDSDLDFALVLARRAAEMRQPRQRGGWLAGRSGMWTIILVDLIAAKVSAGLAFARASASRSAKAPNRSSRPFASLEWGVSASSRINLPMSGQPWFGTGALIVVLHAILERVAACRPFVACTSQRM